MMLTFYRGITVNPEDEGRVRENIFTNGLRVEDSRSWKGFECVKLQSKVKNLLYKEDLTPRDTRNAIIESELESDSLKKSQAYLSICASGCKLGASYYALKHNYNRRANLTSPLLISFKAPVEDLQIDGRDFLYSVFQRSSTLKDIEQLEELFGPKVRLYFDLAASTPQENQDRKIALCDLAIQDKQVIRDHKKNKTTINGRYGVIFKSAFLVRAPIPAQRIVSVDRPKGEIFQPAINVYEFA
ncbi:hypothetical protein OAK16_04635 [Verrucomicrobia bacterium]|nr:hypothetical protein [Verrucomicrobiota bacterium]